MEKNHSSSRNLSRFTFKSSNRRALYFHASQTANGYLSLNKSPQNHIMSRAGRAGCRFGSGKVILTFWKVKLPHFRCMCSEPDARSSKDAQEYLELARLRSS